VLPTGQDPDPHATTVYGTTGRYSSDKTKITKEQMKKNHLLAGFIIILLGLFGLSSLLWRFVRENTKRNYYDTVMQTCGEKWNPDLTVDRE